MKPLSTHFERISLKRSVDESFKSAHASDMVLPKPVNLMPIMGRHQSLLNPDQTGYEPLQPRYYPRFGPEADSQDETYDTQSASFTSQTSSNSPDDFETFLSTLWSNLSLDQLLEICFRKDLPRPTSIAEPIAANERDQSNLEMQTCKDCRTGSRTGEAEPNCRKCDGKDGCTKTSKHRKANMERRAWHKFFQDWLYRLVPDEILKECGFSYVTRTGATQGPTKDVILKSSVLHIQKLIDIIHLLREKDLSRERTAEEMQKDMTRKDATIYELQKRLLEKDEVIIAIQKQVKEDSMCHGILSNDKSGNRPVQSCGVKRPTSVDESRTILSSPETLSTPTAPSHDRELKWKPNVTIVHQKKRSRRTRAGDDGSCMEVGVSA